MSAVHAAETPQQAARRLSAGALRDGFTPQPLHEYTAEGGNPLFWRIRLKHPKTGNKWIRPMHLKDGQFVIGEPAFPNGKPLYRLHELAGNPESPVFIVEGESCADALAQLGLVATTSGGAGSAAAADWKPLTGRAVTIWPDNDGPGQQYAADVAEHLPGCTVRTIDVSALGLPHKGDVVDWLEAHPAATAADVLALPVAATTEHDRNDKRVTSVASVVSWPAPIDEDAYHGLAGDVVRTIEPHTEADPVALLMQFLTAFGSCTGRGPHYQVEGDAHHANLYAVLVGDSSKARKGTSWGRVRALFELLDDPWAAHRVHSGLSSGEGVIWAVRDPIMGREKQGKGASASAQYVECEVDAGISDKRLMVVESEFANVLRVMGREGNTLSRVIRDAWDRGDLAVMTKTSPAVATGAHVSIIGHITGDELRRYLDRTEAANGFANRFLYLCVRRARLLPHGGDLDEYALRPLAQRLAAAIGEARQIDRVRMDDATRAAWERVYPELSEGRPGLVGSITARGEAQVIRLATLYALIDGTDTMNLHHLKAALALWTYAEDSAHYVFGDRRGDPLADALEQALRDAGQHGMTRTAIRDHFKRHADAARIDAALSVLAASGAVVQSKVQTGGRAAEVWRVTATEATKATEGSGMGASVASVAFVAPLGTEK